MIYRIAKLRDNAEVVLVGCGGTGGYVAEGLCRLLRQGQRLILVDPDRVEERNLARQNFYREEIGKYKSQALAERFARQFEREIGYCVHPYSDNLVTEVLTNFGRKVGHDLIIGCVDNADARRAIAEGIMTGWWIDAGNGFNSGQILVGNARKKMGGGGFVKSEGIIRYLPLPTVQQPELLMAAEKREKSCSEEPEQGPVINRVMADLVLQFVWLLMRGELRWMAAYVDLGAGTLNCIEATPRVVAQMLELPERELVS